MFSVLPVDKNIQHKTNLQVGKKECTVVMAATNTVSRNCSCRISIFLRHNMNFTGEKQNPVNFSRIMNGRNPGSRNSGDNCIFSLGHASLQLILPDYFLLLKKSQSSSCILSFFFFFFFLSFFLSIALLDYFLLQNFTRHQLYFTRLIEGFFFA